MHPVGTREHAQPVPEGIPALLMSVQLTAPAQWPLAEVRDHAQPVPEETPAWPMSVHRLAVALVRISLAEVRDHALPVLEEIPVLLTPAFQDVLLKR
jgi:hypothetical protein